jgi:large subunit ribosomal protein L31
MKKTGHPKYYGDAIVSCSCGNTFTFGSTIKEFSVEICSKCHPFYTGEMKFIDTLGRVDKFEKKTKKADKLRSKLQDKKDKKKKREDDRQQQPKTLKEMLQAIG